MIFSQMSIQIILSPEADVKRHLRDLCYISSANTENRKQERDVVQR